MNNKGFAIFVIALIACQGLSNAVPQQKQPKDLKDDAIADLENLKAIVEKAIIDAKAVLKGLKDDLELYAQEMIEQGLADLEAKAKEVIDEIEKIIEEAVEDITACVKGKIDEVKQIPINLGNELVKCITDQLKEGLAIIANAVSLVEGVMTAVQEYEERIKNCSANNVLCFGQIVIDIGKDVTRLPLEITQIVTDTTSFIGTIKSDIEICAIEKVAQCAMEALEILADIVECIANSK